MLTSEERLFSFGESSCLINTERNNLVSAQLAGLLLKTDFTSQIQSF
jgi:hypothetical protein